MPQPTPPASHQDLLDRPPFAHFATIRPDGAAPSGLMWFAWDGERARFSPTRTRQKIRNLEHEPAVSFHLDDPDNPYRTPEARGRVESTEPLRTRDHRVNHPGSDSDQPAAEAGR